MKKATIAIIIAILLTLTCATASATEKARPNLSDFYPNTAVVMELDYELDKVSCVTHRGDIIEFYGCFDWEIGDVVALYMWNCGTCLDITDDEVLDAELGGHMTPAMVAEWLKN